MSDDLQELISHQYWVQANQKLGLVFQAFTNHDFDFMAVLEDGVAQGLCSRRNIGMLLGSQYGFSLFSSKPAKEHILPNPLFVKIGTPINEVFQAAFARSEEAFYEDVILLDAQGKLLGMIATQTLVKLQNRHHLQNIQMLERQSRELRLKNEQIKEDLRLSRELQQALFPARDPDFHPCSPGGANPLRIRPYSRSYGLVGGDFFHIKKLADSTAGVFIADVMGHGVRSALVTGMLRAMLGEMAESEFKNPAGLMRHVNQELCKILSQVEKTTLFATAVYVLVDAENRRFCHAIAGHPLPIHLIRQGGCAEPLEHPDPGPLLGVFDDAAFINGITSYSSGDSLILYTDGISEVANPEGEEFGLARLCSVLAGSYDRPIQEIFAELVAQAERYAGHGGFLDDICLIGIELA